MTSHTHTRRSFHADGMQEGVQIGGLATIGGWVIQHMNDLDTDRAPAEIHDVRLPEILDLTQDSVVLPQFTATIF